MSWILQPPNFVERITLTNVLVSETCWVDDRTRFVDCTQDHVLHNLRVIKSHETIQICRLTISSENLGACARCKIRLSTSREGESPSCNTRKREVQRRSHSTKHSTEETKVDTADCAETIQASTAQIVEKRGSLSFSLTISCPLTEGRKPLRDVVCALEPQHAALLSSKHIRATAMQRGTQPLTAHGLPWAGKAN